MSKARVEQAAELDVSSPSVGAIKASDEGKPEVVVKEKDLHPKVREMIESGIPVRKAVFHRTVIFHSKLATAETHFMSPRWAKDVRKNKMANMWLTPFVLICEQNGEYKFVPLANVSDITY